MWLVLFGTLLLMATPMACTTTIRPPRAVADPVTVLLLDHGRTPSLVLPDATGEEGVRFAYGDWRYYALNDTGVISTVKALGWPTTGALGRRKLPGPIEADAIRAQVPVWTRNVYPIVVERADAERLLSRLEAVYAARHDERVFRSRIDLEFVPHPKPYTYWDNSNHVAAGWLEELGCDVRGPAFNSRWRIAPD